MEEHEFLSLDNAPVGFYLKMASELVDRSMNVQLAEQDITSTQGKVLSMLSCENGQMQLKTIEKRFNVSQATMAGVIARMEDKGFVKTSRNADDRRSKTVTITQLGHEKSLLIHDCITSSEQLIKSNLTEEENNELRRLLRIVVETLR